MEYPDTYFTPGYGEAAAVARGGRWDCARLDEAILLPFVANSVRDGGCDAASPYGYSGIHVAPSCSAEDLARFWKQVKEEWRDNRLVAMFFRFSPLDPKSAQAVAFLEDITLTRRGDTIGIPVDGGPAFIWANLMGRCRNTVRKAQRAGLTAEIRPAQASDLDAGAPFRVLYEQTMRRVGSAEGYLFSDSYYAALLRGLGNGMAIAEVKTPDNAVTAASLIFVHRDRVHYHLAGSDAAGAASGAMNLLLWTVLRWAAENGRRWVHLGGGVRSEDGLFRFKESFGGKRLQFWTGTAVIEPAAYGRLVEQHARDLGVASAQLHESGYFPAYRYGRGLI